jgi:hypothetical protein
MTPDTARLLERVAVEAARRAWQVRERAEAKEAMRKRRDRLAGAVGLRR